MRLIFKTRSVTPDFFYVFNLILSFSTCSQSLKKICMWELLSANVLKTAHCQFTKVSQWNPSESRHWSFPSLAAAQKGVFHYLWPCFYWGKYDQITQRANAKDLRKTGNVVGLIEPMRKGQKPISGEQMKKLFDSGELGRAKSKTPATLSTEDDLVLPQSLFWSTRTRDSTPPNANKSVLAKNPSSSWVFWWAEPKRQLESLPATKNNQSRRFWR